MKHAASRNSKTFTLPHFLTDVRNQNITTVVEEVHHSNVEKQVNIELENLHIMLRLSVISLLAAGSQAAVLTPRAGLDPRQASTTSYATSDLGYSYVNVENGDTTWGKFWYYADYSWTISTDDYYGFCTTYTPYDYSSSVYLTASATDYCGLYTTCSDGVLQGPSTSIDCAANGYKCGTALLFESWGATDAETELHCAYTTENSTTSYFVQKPAARVTELGTTPATTTAVTTPTAEPATPAPTSTAPPATSAPTGGGGGSSNTGVIAGSVVGGVAVLAIAGVAIFWIMRRSRIHRDPHADPHNQSTYAPSGVPSYYQPQPDKPADNMTMMPQYDQHQYDPHGSVVYPHNGTSPQGVGGTSPHPPQSPVPLYPEGFRGEMDGTGVPTVRTPPPQPPHTGY